MKYAIGFVTVAVVAFGLGFLTGIPPEKLSRQVADRKAELGRLEEKSRALDAEIGTLSSVIGTSSSLPITGTLSTSIGTGIASTWAKPMEVSEHSPAVWTDPHSRCDYLVWWRPGGAVFVTPRMRMLGERTVQLCREKP